MFHQCCRAVHKHNCVIKDGLLPFYNGPEPERNPCIAAASNLWGYVNTLPQGPVIHHYVILTEIPSPLPRDMAHLTISCRRSTLSGFCICFSSCSKASLRTESRAACQAGEVQANCCSHGSRWGGATSRSLHGCTTRIVGELIGTVQNAHNRCSHKPKRKTSV